MRQDIEGGAEVPESRSDWILLGRVGSIQAWSQRWVLFALQEYLLTLSAGENLVDCISTAHPSWLIKEEINAVGVPVQILAPEHDPQFTPELKAHANSIISTLNVDFDYQYFPGAVHGFAVRCDQSDAMKKKALERAKNAAVGWFAQHLHLH